MPEKLGEKVLSWASIADEKTIEQARMTATLPFIHPHVALMPDAHLGRGATVGSVLPTKGTIIPAAVGVDIGCGMMAARTQFTKADLGDRSLRVLREAIERAVPLSAGRYNRKVQATAEPRIQALQDTAALCGFDPDSYAENWRLQLGTLGGGNHFIEVCLDEEGRVWLFLHSGSRGVGNKIASHHIKVAQEYCARHYIELPDRDLAYLVEGTEEFHRYIQELSWGQMFAALNRAEMMDRVVSQFGRWIGEDVVCDQVINTHHNYTEKETHFGQDVWLSRKGAIDAHEGVWGLIPGSMGTASYVVRGKGNKVALNSAPHGAGRVYSRTAARKEFTQDDLRERMKGIEFRDSAEFVDEIPDAYKDIDVVMRDAADLVEVIHTLHQIVNVKGD